MLVIQDYIIVFNALYAKKTAKLSYEEIRVYYLILTHKLSKAGFLFITSDEYTDYYGCDVDNYRYIHCGDYVLLFSELDETAMDIINSPYEGEVKRIIVEARDEYAAMDEGLKRPYVKTRNDN